MHLFRPTFTIIFITSSIGALCGDDDPISRDAAIHIALRQSQELNAARTQIEQAMARRNGAGLRSTPEVTFSYATDKTFNDEGESNFGFSFEQAFPVTNRLQLLKDIAAIEIELAKAEIQNQERIISEQVALLFTDLAEVDAQLELRKSKRALNQSFADFIKSRIERAEASSVDLNQIKIELYAIEQEIQHFADTKNQLMARLKHLLGYSIKDSLELALSLELPSILPEFTTWTPANLGNHPEYKLKSLFAEIADQRTSLAAANRWDDIAIELFYENERSIDSPNGIGTDQFFGISVSIPLPLQNNNRATIEANRIQERQIQLELKALAKRIENRSETYRIQATNEYEQARHYRDTIKTLIEQNDNEMNAAHKAGQIGLSELFRSQAQRLKIEAAYITMIHDFEHAIIQWKAANAIPQTTKL